MQKKNLFPLFILLSFAAFAQQNDSTKVVAHISGNASVTNNGVSLVPSFSLEQPATILNMSLQKGRFSFDPELAFSLEEGRPWYHLFWLRYQLVNKGKFRLGAGTHLGLNFIRPDNLPGVRTKRTIVTERYLVGALTPSYIINDHVSLNMAIMVARGFDIGNTTPMKFVSLNASFTNLKLSKKLFMNITPQVFYLDSFGTDGNYYASMFLTFGREGSPFTLNSTLNKVIKTNIEDSKDFIWNLSLNYAFSKRAIVKKVAAGN